jgi:hypothetical protein
MLVPCLPSAGQSLFAGAPDMRVYIDHSIVSTERFWPDLQALLQNKELKLVLSLWNLLEMRYASDVGQREQRMRFLDQFSPLWMLERLDAQRFEVRSFLWKSRYNLDSEWNPVVKNISQVIAHHAGAKTEIGLTPRGWMNSLPLERLRSKKSLAPNALRTLQGWGAKRVKEKQAAIFRAWIEKKIPDRSPDGKVLSMTEKAALLDFCVARKKAFFSACPALAVEDELMLARTANRRRNPTNSDGEDLFHGVMALAYCDAFIVFDGFAEACVRTAKRKLRNLKLADIYSTPGAAITAGIGTVHDSG